ncbi:MAG: MraY family glycosyltransferase [Bacteroidota bacterium]|nr:MraY family glycosyltransferase [Bacteroidota bacterium]
MTSLMLPAVLAFLLVLFGMPSLIMVAKRKHLVDVPSESRKLHHRSVPTVGGVMLFAAAICSSLTSFSIDPNLTWTSFSWLGVLGVTIPVFFMGLKDDIVGISANKKLLVHLVIGAFLVVGLELRIDDFQGIFGLNEIPTVVSIPFSMFVYVVIVNAINLIDGVDGLAGGYGMVAMSAFGMWFHWTGDAVSATVAASLAGALAGFLLFNLHPAKIFMGDSGSLLLGLMAYVMATRVIQSPSEDAMPGVIRPIATMCFLAYPLVDTLRVFSLRILAKRSPFSPDRRHIHHLLMQLGWGHRLTAAALWTYSLVFVVFALQPSQFWGQINVTGQFFVLLGLAFLLGSLPYFMLKTGVGNSQLFPQTEPGEPTDATKEDSTKGPRRVA